MEIIADDKINCIRIINSDIQSSALPDMFTDDCSLVLIWWKDKGNINLSVQSRNREIRALEYADYLAGDYGYVKGDRNAAHAVLSERIFEALTVDCEADGGQDFFVKKTEEYFNECGWIYAENYFKNPDGFEKYVKKQEVWAFVRTTDIAGAGKKLRIRSLENESGAVITASEDEYIMIGCRGEVYDISRKKFEDTYEEDDKKLDIFDRMLDFMPEVMEQETGSCIAIDERARLCHPKSNKAIYAKRLDERVKVFPADGRDYYVGRKGDFIAVREDDLTDVYIIQKNIFDQTYCIFQ